MLHNIEALKAAHAESLREAEEANRIALALPVIPKLVGFALKSLPWVHYEVKTLAEAVEIFKAYTPTPYVIARDGSFCIIATLAEIEKKNENKRNAYKAEQESDGSPYFDCMTGVGFSSVEMRFFTHSADRDIKICVRINESPIRVNLVTADPHLSVAGRRYRKQYPTVLGARLIQWGYGDDCAKGTYWFPDSTSFDACMEQHIDGYKCN